MARVLKLTNRLAGVVLPPDNVNTRGDTFRSRNVFPVCLGPSSRKLTFRSTSGTSRVSSNSRVRLSGSTSGL